MSNQTTSMRTHHCGELRKLHKNQVVTLCGWVQVIRDKGHMLFINLRDRYGTTQIYIEKKTMPQLAAQCHTLGLEYVIQVTGKVVERSSKNPNLATGDIEIVPQRIQVLNKCMPLPFLLQNTEAHEALRMKYRYLDLRRPSLQKNIILRHQVVQAARTFLHEQHFVEIETPILLKSTPEGARDFVVPSRLHPGKYYALPQSPQIPKQTLMISGFDRYYQLAKCFRDEDLRRDRQPEFTQIDLEVSFVNRKDIMQLTEKLIKYIWQHVIGVNLKDFPRMTYQEAIQKYGCDKPDLRWDMPFVDITEYARGYGFELFDKADNIIALCIKQGSMHSRKTLDRLQSFVKDQLITIDSLAYVKYSTENTIKSSVDKFYPHNQLKQWLDQANATKGDLLLVVASKTSQTREELVRLRQHIINELNITPHVQYAPLWVTDFPLFERIENVLSSVHHPFTAPRSADNALLDTKPENAISQAYDLVINGQELGSGSIRIHQRSQQEKIFQLLGMSPQKIQKNFGFLLDALKYGSPPHGGIALGLARICTLISGDLAIRDYIAFPKNNQGRDTMMNAPS